MPPHGRLSEHLFPTVETGVDLVAVRKAGRDVAGEDVDLLRRVAQCTGRDPDGAPQGIGGRSSGDGYPPTRVAPLQLVPHLVAALGAEVQVDVRRVPSLLVHEPLEEQAVGEGLGLRQAQTVRDQAVRRAPSARDRHALFAGYLHGLQGQQEVRREAQVLDARELTPQARNDLSVQSPVPLPRAAQRELDEDLPRVFVL